MSLQQAFKPGMLQEKMQDPGRKMALSNPTDKEVCHKMLERIRSDSQILARACILEKNKQKN